MKITFQTKFISQKSFILTLVLLFVSSCGAAPEPALPTATLPAPTAIPSGRGSGGTLRIIYWQAPSILNPHLAPGIKDWEVNRITYEPLATYDKEGKLVPILATEIPTHENGELASDGKSVTWKLKQGVKWSDGQPFSADDVLFTYQFVTNKDVASSSVAAYSQVKDVQVLDPYSVKVTFKDVNPAWSQPFVAIYGWILPRHVFATYNDSNARNAPANMMPVGTGPYRVVSFKPQEVLFLGNALAETNKIVYEPNPFFREADKPYFSRVELRGGGTANEAARSVLQTAEADYAWNLQIPPTMITQLQGLNKGKIVPNLQPRVERLMLNRTDPNQVVDGERSNINFPHPFLSDLKVRQAFNLAIDREAIAKIYPGSEATANNLVEPPSFSSPNIHFEYNPQKAAQLLDEAGWKDTDSDGIRNKDGVKMKVVYQAIASPTVQKSQEIIQSNLKAIGVEVEVKVVDSGAYLNKSNPNSIYQFPADIEQVTLNSTNPIPIAYMGFWTCNQIPQKANNWSAGTSLNVERWCNPDYDALYRKATQETDPDKLHTLLIQMNDMLIQNVVMIPLFHLANLSGAVNDLKGVDLTPWDGDMWNIKDWRK